MSTQAVMARQLKASKLAETILSSSGVRSIPVEPLTFIKENCPKVRAVGADFRNQFDGQLEYHPKKKLFLLFYNNKYDRGFTPGMNHPRTRFSIAHELGHYFLDEHRYLLLKGQRSHCSASEFRSDIHIEREADSFAAAFLMPSYLLKPSINKLPLTKDRLIRTATHFNTSLVSTAIRTVQLSDFPCGLVGIREGEVAWTFASPALIAAGIYPNNHGAILSSGANDAWKRFPERDLSNDAGEVPAKQWFKTFRDDFQDVWAKEEYIPAPILGTLLVLVTIDEENLMVDEPEEYEDDEE